MKTWVTPYPWSISAKALAPVIMADTLTPTACRNPWPALRAPASRGTELHRCRTEDSQNAFFEDTWKVANEADRMGYRFQAGRTMEFVKRKQPFGAGSDPSNITDACYPYGSVQVPSGTEPIILHRDAVSGGGYCMIGTIISADMDLIGQLQPNTPTRFVQVDLEIALQARAERNAVLSALRESLA